MGEAGSAPEAASSSAGAVAPPGRGAHRRISPTDLTAFRRALDASTRQAIITPMIVLAGGASFAAMIAAGVPIRSPSASALVDWGANDGARLILRHEYWRLIASVFVHGGIVHLAVNMWSLLMIGPLVERIYGHLAFAALYLISGVGGAIASVAVPPMRVSVGASGAICGILGGLLAFLLAHRRSIPATVLRHLSRNVLAVVAIMAVLGAFDPHIDQAAHLGGLATGFASGLLLIGPWPVAPGPGLRLLARRAALTVAIAGGLSAAAIAVADRGDAIIAPARRLDDLTEQFSPVIREFYAIRNDLAAASRREDVTGDPAERGAQARALQRLRGRAAANGARLRRVRTSHHELEAIRASLARALAAQAARIEALYRYLDNGDRNELRAAREALATTVEAARECEERWLHFLDEYRLRDAIERDPDR